MFGAGGTDDASNPSSNPVNWLRTSRRDLVRRAPDVVSSIARSAAGAALLPDGLGPLLEVEAREPLAPHELWSASRNLKSPKSLQGEK
jgi:hypothetical protein